MRRAAWLALAVVSLGAWLGAGALRSDAPAVEAQTPADPIQIRRVQHADHLPAPVRQGPIFLLAIGSDARPGVCMPVERCLADSLHLIGVNPQQGSATILGFPRDSYVSIPGKGTGRINEALLLGGPQLVVRTVEALTGIRVDYYMLTSFDGLPAMVNDVGGIEVDVPYAMNDEASGAVFRAGRQVLDGRQALAFSRNRKDTPNGDFSRSENHGILLRAALEELHRDVGRDPAVLFRWVVTGLRHVDTDLSLVEVFDLMLTAVSIEPQRVTNCVVPGTLGFAGAASVVLITDAAKDVYRDLARDGVARC